MGHGKITVTARVAETRSLYTDTDPAFPRGLYTNPHSLDQSDVFYKIFQDFYIIFKSFKLLESKCSSRHRKVNIVKIAFF